MSVDIDKTQTINGKWILNKKAVQGILTITHKQIYLKLQVFKRQGMMSGLPNDLSFAYSNNTNEGKVSLYDLILTGDSHRGDGTFHEYTYDVRRIIIDGKCKPDKKIFKSASFTLHGLTKDFFILLKENHKTVENITQIDFELQRESVVERIDNYTLKTNYGTSDIRSNGYEHVYGSYAQIELVYDHLVSANIIKDSFHEVIHLFAFLTKKMRYPEDIYLYTSEKIPPLPLKLKDINYFTDYKEHDYSRSLFELRQKPELLKIIIKNWHTLFLNKATLIYLFQSDITNEGQFLDNKFFNVATVLDNLLISKFGKYFAKSKYSHLTYPHIQKELEILNQKKLKDPKYKKGASFKDRLLLYLSSLNFDLDSKLSSYLQDIPNVQKLFPENNHRYEYISNLIVDLRNDIGQGKKRRYENYMYSIYLMAKIISLNMLLEELNITDTDRKSIIDNLSLNYF